MTTLKGVLEFYSETGTEGGHWAFQDAAYITLKPSWCVFGRGETVYDPATGQAGRAVRAQRPDGRRVKSIRPHDIVRVQVEWVDGTSSTQLMSDLLSPSWDREGLHVLHDGDQLTIYHPDDPAQVVWSGTIQLHQYNLFTEDAYGFWIHADQVGLDRAVWAEWFLKRYPAEVTLGPDRDL